MRRKIKQAISFFMAVCLLAGNSYVDMGTSAVTMTDWVEVSPEETKGQEIKEPLLLKSLQQYYETTVRKASAETNKNGGFAFYNPTAGSEELIKQGEAIQITTLQKEFQVVKLDENGKITPSTGKIEIINVGLENEVIRTSINPDDPSRITITALTAGSHSLNVTVKETTENRDENGNVIGTTVETLPLNIKIEVPIRINTSDGEYWKQADSKDEKILVLDATKLEEGQGYPIQLLDVENKNIDSDLIEWDYPLTDVIKVDFEKGTIIPIGAGEAKVTLTSKGVDDIKPVSFTVIVSPKGKKDENDKYESKISMDTSQDTIELFTNGNPASNIQWKIYSIIYGKDDQPISTEILEKDTSLLTREISTEDGKITLSGLKAGTYQVVGYISDSDKLKDEEWNYMQFDIVVNIRFENPVNYMNTGGDSFSILDNSNISPKHFASFIHMKVLGENTDSSNINRSKYVELYPEKGIVSTRTNEGTAYISVEYMPSGSKESIYKSNDKNYNAKETYTFHIIDKISLNVTELTMYTNSTYQLILNTTNENEQNAKFDWESSDEKYVTIEGEGKEVTIKAHKVTETDRPVIITASQEINGVKKFVSCEITIQQAVSQIKLPELVTIPYGERKWISADIEPDDTGAKIIWLTSDKKVFDIDFEKSHNAGAELIANGAGTAILTAVDSRNVVLGFCKVVVTQDVTGIKLDQTSLTVNLSDKTYILKATLSPENATNQEIEWDSSNTSIATVDNGKVTFKKAGTVVISAWPKGSSVKPATCTITIRNVVSSITLDDSDIEMYVGENRRLSYTLTPSDAANKNLEWTSFNTSVVTVDDTGMLTAKGPGTTQVMVMTEEGAYYDLCTVTVKQQATGVKMSYTAVSLNVGEYFDMDVTITPANSTEVSLIWESLNTDIATVSSTGRITGRAVGTAIIMVKTQNGVTSRCTVTVIDPVLSLELDSTEITIDVNESFVIDPVFKPAKPSNMEVKWSSSNEDVAEIDEFGEVTGIAGGTAVITCESVDGGYRAFCQVTVIEPVVEITMSPETYRLGLGNTYTLTATITNHGTATDIGIEWRSSDESICSVDEKGRITGVNYGYATIYAEAADDLGAFATCEVRVVREVTSVKLNHTILTLIQGESASLQTTIQPSNASYQTAIFSSSDESVAIVDEDGVITALTPGSAMIRADARDNSGKYAICYLTVIAPIPSTGVTVSDKELVLTPGEKKQVVISIKPNNSTDTKTWTSNNEAVASVNSSGTITAHTTGTATITVMTSSGKTATVNVTVLGLSRTTLEIPIYTKFTRLSVDGATGTVRWDVADPTICEVNNGIITARKLGTTKITATINGRTLTCTIKVVR